MCMLEKTRLELSSNFKKNYFVRGVGGLELGLASYIHIEKCFFGFTGCNEAVYQPQIIDGSGLALIA